VKIVLNIKVKKIVMEKTFMCMLLKITEDLLLMDTVKHKRTLKEIVPEKHWNFIEYVKYIKYLYNSNK
jgi:hypothetical protein